MLTVFQPKLRNTFLQIFSNFTLLSIYIQIILESCKIKMGFRDVQAMSEKWLQEGISFS